MNTTTEVKVSETRQPSLTRAVIRQIGERESLEDVARHGADGGFSGFTYYSDTVEFTKRNKAEILQRMGEDCNDIGYESVNEMMSKFRCLEGCKPDEIAEALWNHRSELRTQVYNAMAWYACEEIARELNPDL